MKDFTPRCFSRRSRQRGSVLVLVLGVTSIVGVIGLSSLLAVRLQHRDVQSRADAAQAQQLADGALQLLHARLSDDNSWRTNHTHNSWTADESLGSDSTLRYKLEDQDDADLSDDDNDDARLTVRVAHGDAVRLASVELAGNPTLGPELITNGDMESGASEYGTSVGNADITIQTSNPHAGASSLLLANRNSSYVAVKQNLLGLLASGRTYRVSAWVRLEDSAMNVKLGLVNNLNIKEDQAAAITGDWTYLQFELTPTHAITASTSYVYALPASGEQDLHLDDLSVREVLNADAGLPVVRGSYRRELDE